MKKKTSTECRQESVNVIEIDVHMFKDPTSVGSPKPNWKQEVEILIKFMKAIGIYFIHDKA